MLKRWIFIFLIFAVAVAFRLWIIHLVPQPFIYDQTTYEDYARKMYSSSTLLAAHTFRSYPYPFLLAVIYKFAGFGNHTVVFVVQAIIDSFTGLYIYFILRLAGKNRAAWIGFLLYAINPFTAGYTGVVLSEVLTIFFIAGTLLTGLLLIKKSSVFMGSLFGLCAGLAFQTRNAMLIGSLAALGSVWFWISWKTNKHIVVSVIFGLVITAIYPLYTNWVTYHEITPFKVDSFYAMELYNGATLKILPPFMSGEEFPIGQQQMYWEYWSEYFPNRTAADRLAMAKKYLNKAVAIVAADPWDYIRWRFYKMWYVWQKDNIYSYLEPGYFEHRSVTFWVNTLLLSAATMGFIFMGFQKKNRFVLWLWAVSIAMVLLQTFAFCFSHAEYRLSIPLYPIIFLFVAFVLDGIIGVRRNLLK